MKKLLLIFFAFHFSLFTLKAQNIITIAGDANPGFSGDGKLATSNFCELNSPYGIYVDKTGKIYISDEDNDVVRMVNTQGVITTFAGNHLLGNGYSGDGNPATEAQLNYPTGVCEDDSGNIYIGDGDNNVIRMVNTSGIISTVVGTGIHGFSGDGGLATAAELDGPILPYFDVHGNLLFSDYQNQRIRKVNTSGIISTVAGNGKYGFSGDGSYATSAELWAPGEVCTDSAGNIYIADQENSRIRKVNTSGIISTIAGNGANGFSGDGGQAASAELYIPFGICLDDSGNILITDGDNFRVRKINTSGIISTIAGNGHFGYSGNGGPATDAELAATTGICTDSYGNIYFADYGNNVVREIVYKIINTSEDISNSESKMNINIYPNPTTDKLFIICDRSPPQIVNITISDITGRELIIKEVSPFSQVKSTIDVSSLSSGIYFITISSSGNTKTMKFIKQ